VVLWLERLLAPAVLDKRVLIATMRPLIATFLAMTLVVHLVVLSVTDSFAMVHPRWLTHTANDAGSWISFFSTKIEMTHSVLVSTDDTRAVARVSHVGPDIISSAGLVTRTQHGSLVRCCRRTCLISFRHTKRRSLRGLASSPLIVGSSTIKARDRLEQRIVKALLTKRLQPTFPTHPLATTTRTNSATLDHVHVAWTSSLDASSVYFGA